MPQKCILVTHPYLETWNCEALLQLSSGKIVMDRHGKSLGSRHRKNSSVSKGLSFLKSILMRWESLGRTFSPYFIWNGFDSKRLQSLFFSRCVQIRWAIAPWYHRMGVHAKSLQSCLTLCDPMDCNPPGSSSMGFSRQEYWSGLPCPPPGDLPEPGIKPRSPMFPALAGGFFTTSTTWEAQS